MAADSGILLVHDGASPRPDILGALLARYTVLPRPVRDRMPARRQDHTLMVVDVNIRHDSDVMTLRKAIQGFADRTVGRLFVSDADNRRASMHAAAFGAQAVVSRPLRADSLYSSVERLLFEQEQHNAGVGERQREGLYAGLDAIEQVMQFATSGQPIDQEQLDEQGDTIVGALGETSLSEWIEAVKRHHSRTFRHSLLVTGVAVGFGQMLGFGLADQRRLALGGLLHDIGKARIHLDILEKPGALTPAELEVMRGHARIGRNIMLDHGGFNGEMVNVVGMHHELLDGSGYPDGLAGSSIPDLVRTITIADIFAALIEERSYKSRMTSVDAYDIMVKMRGKLDPTLLGAFAHIALRTPLAS